MIGMGTAALVDTTVRSAAKTRIKLTTMRVTLQATTRRTFKIPLRVTMMTVMTMTTTMARRHSYHSHIIG